MKTPLLKPPALRYGDTIAVVAPASGPPPDRLDAGIASLEAAGYEVRTYREFSDPSGYLSASDDARVEEINLAIHDEDVGAILAARGGYGVSRILDRIDYEGLRKRPKIVAGYSDLTALHAAIGRRTGVVSFHSPHAVDGLGPAGACESTTRSFLRTIGEAETPPPIHRAPEHADAVTAHDWAGGSAEGRLVGGNLAVLCALLGTPYEPDTRGALLLIEDTGEAVYRVDRMLSQLRLAGKLDEAAGFVLGYFGDFPLDEKENPRAVLRSVLRGYLEPLGVPVLGGVPIGHSLPNHTVAIGARYRIETESGRLSCLESVVSP